MLGAGIANNITKDVSVPATKVIVDSMYEGGAGDVG
tara:strand:+ start:99 stop:206 length:108 start_codon:yes stop_codon:yes gene_type:complete